MVEVASPQLTRALSTGRIACALFSALAGLLFAGTGCLDPRRARPDESVADRLDRDCDRGSVAACTALGSVYFLGRAGRDKDERRTVEPYRRACEGGSTSSCALLGFMFENGRG